jgi:hypothetical protein
MAVLHVKDKVPLRWLCVGPVTVVRQQRSAILRSRTPRTIQMTKPVGTAGTVAVPCVANRRADEGVDVTKGTMAVPCVTHARRAWIVRDAQARSTASRPRPAPPPPGPGGAPGYPSTMRPQQGTSQSLAQSKPQHRNSRSAAKPTAAPASRQKLSGLPPSAYGRRQIRMAHSVARFWNWSGMWTRSW